MNENVKYWLENAFLAALLAGLGFVYFSHTSQTAQAAGGGWDTDGIMAVTSTGSQPERFVIVNTKKKSICVYNNRGTGEFNLTTARNYEYDFLIKDESALPKNKKELTYIQVRAMHAAKPK